MKTIVLVIGVHPDDETLGAGGTLLKHKSEKDEIHWLICTSLDEKHEYYKKRAEEINKVKELYEFDSVHELNFKTTEIDKYSQNDLIKEISKVVNEVKPQIVYLPFKNDVHSDHRIIFDTAYSCTKSFRYPFIKKILAMETLSETEFSHNINNTGFNPNYFVDVSDFFSRKIDIIKVYESEIKNSPFPRSIEIITALAKYRGSTVNCEYAESFILIKAIQ
jgi:LmbE family N-acetylglucosaminyl deacetylase